MTVELANVPSISIACGVLHNFVKHRGVPFGEHEIMPEDTPIRRVMAFHNQPQCLRLRLAYFQHWLAHRGTEATSEEESDDEVDNEMRD